MKKGDWSGGDKVSYPPQIQKLSNDAHVVAQQAQLAQEAANLTPSLKAISERLGTGANRNMISVNDKGDKPALDAAVNIAKVWYANQGKQAPAKADDAIKGFQEANKLKVDGGISAM